jgi:eukaryotic-like serine/threonine-protein kinase
VLPKRYDAPVLVAHGGMGDVYRATDSVLSRAVAVKLLSERYAQQDDARARFRREALAAARLSHAANVVTVFDVAEHRGRPLIVMEYIDGGTVHERLRSGVVSRADALTWLEQAARALDRAHEYGVVHRDVKPANLLLDRDGNVHVSDFGIASVAGVDSLTAPGTVLGTAGYLAPEQARGEPATPASDRYALAVVAFELLTGRRPFEGDTPTTEAFAHLNADVPSATALDPTLPARVDEVFERALAKDPETRPATAQALVTDLREALAGERTADVPTLPIGDPGEPTRRLVRRSRRPRGALAAVVATGVLAVGFVVAALIASGDDPGGTPASREPQAASTTSESTTTEASAPTVDGAALNEEGFARLQAGDYAGALPLLRAAVVALNGTNLLTEAFASYNLAFARFATGRCDGVVGLLDRSARIQGKRKEIDELRRQWEARCATGGEGDQADESGSPGKGRGKDKKGNEG